MISSVFWDDPCNDGRPHDWIKLDIFQSTKLVVFRVILSTCDNIHRQDEFFYRGDEYSLNWLNANSISRCICWIVYNMYHGFVELIFSHSIKLVDIRVSEWKRLNWLNCELNLEVHLLNCVQYVPRLRRANLFALNQTRGYPGYSFKCLSCRDEFCHLDDEFCHSDDEFCHLRDEYSLISYYELNLGINYFQIQLGATHPLLVHTTVHNVELNTVILQ